MKIITPALAAGILAFTAAGCADMNTTAESDAAPAASASADVKTVGGAPMYPNRNIIENASQSADHETLVAAVQAADLVDTLSGPGPFTVFAPTDAAFDKLPENTVTTLLRPENKALLQKILTYHVVSANAFSDAINTMIADDGGAHPVPTVSGGELIARRSADGGITLTDDKGRTANVTIADVAQSNGVIHVIDTVLLPN